MAKQERKTLQQTIEELNMVEGQDFEIVDNREFLCYYGEFSKSDNRWEDFKDEKVKEVYTYTNQFRGGKKTIMITLSKMIGKKRIRKEFL